MSFNDIKGQETAVRCLRSAIKNGRVAHAYIFAGPRASGRSLLAKNFAKALNCSDPENFPCDTCNSCMKIDKDIYPDVKSVAAHGRGGDIVIEEIRNIESGIILKPYEGRYKVFIIKDAHLMNAAAANSFLKTLEEPPVNSVLILITERPSDLVPTIASRCQIIRFRPAGADTIMRDERDNVLRKFEDDKFIENFNPGDRESIVGDLSVLAGWYRDILVYSVTEDAGLVKNSDKIDDIRREGKLARPGELLTIFGNVVRAQEAIKSNVNPKLALSALLKTPQTGA
ncbi:MAG: DNA polymerase III subunit [Candidatus Omnitrophota bacterium]|nr:DNA polymerase III subunit [Candidatus Omnitrophota bacterium]